MSLLSLGSRGMGPRSLLREVLGELSSSLSLGTGSTGAVDLLLVLFKKKKKKKENIYFLKKGLPRVLSLIGRGSYLIAVLI